MQIETKQYDKVVGYAGRCRKPMVDWVTEYTLIDTMSYTIEQFENILKDAHKDITGMVTFIKKKLTYGNGRVEYKHIAQCVSF